MHVTKLESQNTFMICVSCGYETVKGVLRGSLSAAHYLSSPARPAHRARSTNSHHCPNLRLEALGGQQ